MSPRHLLPPPSPTLPPPCASRREGLEVGARARQAHAGTCIGIGLGAMGRVTGVQGIDEDDDEGEDEG